MTLNDLVLAAAAAYPDWHILRCWDANRHRIRPIGGDTLALFVVRELADTYVANAPDAQQLAAASGAIQRAIHDLEQVRDSLADMVSERRAA